MSYAWASFDVNVPVTVLPDDAGYISHCPLLDVYSQGSTQDEALENIVEALELFIESCYSRGCLDEVLKDCGFALESSPGSQRSPRLGEDEHAVRIPLSLVADAKNKEHRQANAR